MFEFLNSLGLVGPLLVSSALTSVPQEDGRQSAEPAQPQPQPPGGIVIRSGPHLRDIPLRRNVETSSCLPDVVAIDVDYLLPRGGGGWLVRVVGITINGRAVDAERIHSINLAVQSFQPPPRIIADCGGDNFRLHLVQSDRDRVVRSEHFNLLGRRWRCDGPHGTGGGDGSSCG